MTVTVTIPKSAILVNEATQPLKAKTYNQKDKSSVSKSTIHLWAGTGKGRRRQDEERFSQSSKRDQGITYCFFWTMLQSTKFLVSLIQGFPPRRWPVPGSWNSIVICHPKSLGVEWAPNAPLEKLNTTNHTMWVWYFAKTSTKYKGRKRIKSQETWVLSKCLHKRRAKKVNKIKARKHAVCQVLHAWVTWYWSSVYGHLLSLPCGKRMNSVTQPGGRGKREGPRQMRWHPPARAAAIFVSSGFFFCLKL